MSLKDAKMVLSNGQAETTVATHASTNVIDFGIADPNKGEGRPIRAKLVVEESCTSGGSATVAIKLQESSDNGDSDAFADLVTIYSGAYSGLTKGTEIVVYLPAEHERYIRGVYVIGIAALTAGKFTLDLMD